MKVAGKKAEENFRETYDCFLCGGSLLEDIEHHQDYTLYHCKTCDCQFWHPLEYPGTGFYNKGSSKYKYRKRYRYTMPWNHRQFFKNKESFKGKLLDIGCSYGEFLNECRKVGYTVSGIEVDKGAVEFARSEGIDVYWGTLDEFVSDRKGDLFDCVTFFEVLEHLTDPVSFLNSVGSVLKPKGRIVLSVPFREKTKVLNFSDCPPGHFTRWNCTSLTNLLKKTGFEVDTLISQPFGLRYIVGHIFQSDFFSKLSGNRFMWMIKLFLSVTMGGLLWVPLKLVGGKGGYIYAVATKK